MFLYFSKTYCNWKKKKYSYKSLRIIGHFIMWNPNVVCWENQNRNDPIIDGWKICFYINSTKGTTESIFNWIFQTIIMLWHQHSKWNTHRESPSLSWYHLKILSDFIRNHINTIWISWNSILRIFCQVIAIFVIKTFIASNYSDSVYGGGWEVCV